MDWLLKSKVNNEYTNTFNFACEAQLHDTAVKLMEPCREHNLEGYHHADSFIQTDHPIYASRRYDCPACIESLKQEAGIE